MPPVERITHDDLVIYEILRHPVLCGEFIRNIDLRDTDEPWEFTWYQKDMICDFSTYVSICCARSVGKTEALAVDLLHLSTRIERSLPSEVL